MTDVEKIRNIFLQKIMEQYDIDFRNSGIEHTFAVVHFSTLLAKQKNERLDLAQIASYLHDIAYYTSHYENNHAKRSADMAKTILETATHLSFTEIEIVIQAIAYHSDKDKIHDGLCEILKNADVLAHALNTPIEFLKEVERKRWQNIHLSK